MSSGHDLARVDEVPEPLALLQEVQAAAIVLLAARPEAEDRCRMVPDRLVRRLLLAVERSAPGSVDSVRRALGNVA